MGLGAMRMKDLCSCPILIRPKLGSLLFSFQELTGNRSGVQSFEATQGADNNHR